METTAPGKFTVNLAGTERSLIITFGLRSEILRLLTKKQFEYRTLSAKNMLPNEMRAKLAEAVEALNALKTAPVKPEQPEDGVEYFDQEKIDAQQEVVTKLYEESIAKIDELKDEVTQRLAMGIIDLTDEAMAEMLALVLSTRDKDGQVTALVTKEQVLHGPEYAEDADELLSLVEGIMQYLTEALKKIQAVSQMVTSLVRAD